MPFPTPKYKQVSVPSWDDFSETLTSNQHNSYNNSETLTFNQHNSYNNSDNSDNSESSKFTKEYPKYEHSKIIIYTWQNKLKNWIFVLCSLNALASICQEIIAMNIRQIRNETTPSSKILKQDWIILFLSVGVTILFIILIIFSFKFMNTLFIYTNIIIFVFSLISNIPYHLIRFNVLKLKNRKIDNAIIIVKSLNHWINLIYFTAIFPLLKIKIMSYSGK